MQVLAKKRAAQRPPVIHLLGAPAESKLPMARLIAAELASRAAAAAGGSVCGVTELNLTAAAGMSDFSGDSYVAATAALCGARCPHLVVLAHAGAGGGDDGGLRAAEALLRCARALPPRSARRPVLFLRARPPRSA
jgi:hypothetical protein